MRVISLISSSSGWTVVSSSPVFKAVANTSGACRRTRRGTPRPEGDVCVYIYKEMNATSRRLSLAGFCLAFPGLLGVLYVCFCKCNEDQPLKRKGFQVGL